MNKFCYKDCKHYKIYGFVGCHGCQVMNKFCYKDCKHYKIYGFVGCHGCAGDARALTGRGNIQGVDHMPGLPMKTEQPNPIKTFLYISLMTFVCFWLVLIYQWDAALVAGRQAREIRGWCEVESGGFENIDGTIDDTNVIIHRHRSHTEYYTYLRHKRLLIHVQILDAEAGQ